VRSVLRCVEEARASIDDLAGQHHFSTACDDSRTEQSSYRSRGKRNADENIRILRMARCIFFLRSVALRKETNTEGKFTHRLAVSEEIPRNAVYMMIRCG
jgi:hypothetical protein